MYEIGKPFPSVFPIYYKHRAGWYQNFGLAGLSSIQDLWLRVEIVLKRLLEIRCLPPSALERIVDFLSERFTMSHRRVKAIDYDEDDYFDNEDAFEELQDQGPSAEDKEQLRLGTIEVRRELGTSFDASDLEIQEALWYYYYDLGKTITYIKSAQSTLLSWIPKVIADAKI